MSRIEPNYDFYDFSLSYNFHFRKLRFFAVLVISVKFAVLVEPFSHKFGQYSLSYKSTKIALFRNSFNFRKIRSSCRAFQQISVGKFIFNMNIRRYFQNVLLEMTRAQQELQNLLNMRQLRTFAVFFFLILDISHIH